MSVRRAIDVSIPKYKPHQYQQSEISKPLASMAQDTTTINIDNIHLIPSLTFGVVRQELKASVVGGVCRIKPGNSKGWDQVSFVDIYDSDI
jgi:hypothetical protein